MGNPNRAGHARLIALVVVVIAAGAMTGCAPAAPQRQHDPWFDDDGPPIVTGDLDEAEARWRKEIAAERATDPDALLADDPLLTDDPPAKPDAYGAVASEDGVPPPPTTLWGKVKSGAETVGKASFAAVSVIVTLGMMVAPYLLL